MMKALLFMGLTLLLIACTALSALVAAPTGTAMPTLSSTTQPTHSPTPSPSPTAEPTGTSTDIPSATPEPVLSLTPTALFVSPSPTPTVPSRLDCKLIWQSPGNDITYKPNKEFTAGWKVRNDGTDTWDVDSVEFTYLRGAKLYDYPVVHLKTSVAPGQEVILSVHMRAPKNLTRYTTYWSLRQGDTFFCPVMLTINIE